MGSLSLLQGFFPTQRSNPGLPHCRWSLHQLSHKGSSKILESLLQWIFPTQESNQGLLHCRQILYQLSYEGSPKLAPISLFFFFLDRRFVLTVDLSNLSIRFVFSLLTKLRTFTFSLKGNNLKLLFLASELPALLLLCFRAILSNKGYLNLRSLIPG